MRKLFAYLSIAIIAMSFKTVEKVTVHYPDFIIVMAYESPTAKNKHPVSCDIKAYYKGVLVTGCNDYFENIDSVSMGDWNSYVSPELKKVGVHSSNKFDQFYSRVDKFTWKKYGPDKKLIGIITEFRNETITDPAKYNFGTKVYYKVR